MLTSSRHSRRSRLASFVYRPEAIARAKELAPDRRPHVERSEYTNNGKPGKFRK
jgi:hypothetical protein